VLQERLLGAAYYYARYGFGLSAILCERAANAGCGHAAIWL
jgi:hypothetical protein